jgi:hypothetical protein
MAIVASQAASNPPQLENDIAPHNIEAEQALLGAILLDNGAVARVNHSLSASDFYDPVHGAIYTSACALVQAGRVANPTTLRNNFIDAEPIAPDLTVPQYLGWLAIYATTIRNVSDYARIIRDCSIRRLMLIDGEEVARQIRDTSQGTAVDTVLAEARLRLLQIQESYSRTSASKLIFPNDIPLAESSPYLIKGVLLPASTAILYGPSAAGKTFLVIHIACCIASGLDFFGRPVADGATLYVVLEGQHGFDLRIKAALERHPSILNRLAYLKTAMGLASPESAMLAIGNIIDAAQQLERRSQAPVRLIVIDTLARAMAGANENDAAAVSEIMNSATAIQAETGAAVLFVHHPGKDSNKGMRGSSALLAAADTVICVDRHKAAAERNVIVEKCKDGEEGELGSFTLERVSFASDVDPSFSSCVISASIGYVRRKRRPGAATAAGKALEELEELAIEQSGTVPPVHPRAPTGVRVISKTLWKERCARQHLSNGKEKNELDTFNRAVRSLSEAHLIGTHGDGVWLINDKSQTQILRD